MKRKERKGGKERDSSRERDRGNIGRGNAKGRESAPNSKMSINHKDRLVQTTETDVETIGEGADQVAVVPVVKTQCLE